MERVRRDRPPLDQPGSTWSYRPYASVDGGTFHLRIEAEEPYPGYLIELEKRDREEALDLPALDEPAKPLEIRLKKFAMRLDLETAAHCWLAFSDVLEPTPDWVKEILDRAKDRILSADT